MNEMDNLQKNLTSRIENLIGIIDFPTLYKNYQWKSDNWENGFSEICFLEKEIGSAARSGTLSRSHLIDVAKWGGLPNINRIRVRDPIKLSIFQDGKIAYWAKNEPENVIRILEGQIRGFGPTYTSKVLRFAAPDTFGAIDTRIVRVFGKDGLRNYQDNFLNLRASPIDGRWAILTNQAGWPGEYSTWIKVLTYIRSRLNENGINCPHPKRCIDEGLRSWGVWLNADVEMALFNYASQRIRSGEV